ncbi:hypothetical protein B0J14DRAFT_652196 [Halenospora varia]|nr:hypothetical protein B0J14DRAFT_652196 [Halenospora varia]
MEPSNNQLPTPGIAPFTTSQTYTSPYNHPRQQHHSSGSNPPEPVFISDIDPNLTRAGSTTTMQQDPLANTLDYMPTEWLFNPPPIPGGPFYDSQIEWNHGPWSYVAMAGLPNDEYGNVPIALLISITGHHQSGEARENGETTEAQTTAGIFVGRNSKYNRACKFSRMPDGSDDKAAHLAAAYQGLDRAIEIARRCEVPGLTRIAIKSDSDYLVRGMTNTLVDYEGVVVREGLIYHEGDETRVTGREKVHDNWFYWLDKKVETLGSLGVQVYFWLVPKERNHLADAYACM